MNSSAHIHDSAVKAAQTAQEPSRRRRQWEGVHERILTAALVLFERMGYEATTLDRIAEEADVARQTALNHFPSKRNLLVVWAERRRAQLDERLSLSPASTARERLIAYYDRLATANVQERNLTRKVRPFAVEQLGHPVPAVIVAALSHGRATGEFDFPEDSEVIAELLTAVYFDTQGRWLGPEIPPFDLAAELHSRIAIVLRACETRIPAPVSSNKQEQS